MKDDSRLSVKPAPPGDARTQYAALPWRVDRAAEVLLVSSRDTRRWIIPKGWPMKGRRPHAAAATEAMEEAGVLGKIEKTPIGCFHYFKRLKNGARLLCKVDVFPLKVPRQKKSWPEKGQRVTQWVPLATAAELVDEPELSKLIESFALLLENGRVGGKANGKRKAPPAGVATL